MKRIVAGLVLGLLTTTSVAGSTLAAMTITVTASPAEGRVGRPVEVLLRTYVPVGEDVVDLPPPVFPFPVASGLRNLLYPVADYPFDVVAQTEDGTSLAVPMVRDPSDATLWRGTFTPARIGDWTIAARNFPRGESGASALVTVAPGEDADQTLIVGAVSLAGGVLVGLLLGRLVLARSRRTR